MALTNSKHTWTTHKYVLHICVCRYCGFEHWRHKSTLQADKVTVRCMCVCCVNVDGGQGLGLCCPGDEVGMHASGVSCNVDYLHLVMSHRSDGECNYGTRICVEGGLATETFLAVVSLRYAL